MVLVTLQLPTPHRLLLVIIKEHILVIQIQQILTLHLLKTQQLLQVETADIPTQTIQTTTIHLVIIPGLIRILIADIVLPHQVVQVHQAVGRLHPAEVQVQHLHQEDRV